MDHAAFLRLIRGETRGVLATTQRWGLSTASLAYGLGVALRNARYDRDPSRSARADVPVISIGNLTVGGTGKTPMVEWVARWFRRRDVRTTILSRGYGATQGLNDEGLVLADNLPDVPHLQDRDRVGLAKIAVDELEAQLLILDDGFQHRQLARDLDIVLLDALDPFGLGRLLPRGLLREPLTSLKRASLVVLSRADLVDASTRSRIKEQVEAARGVTPWVETRHAPIEVLDSEGGSSSLQSLAGQNVLAFCGIGNPRGFERTLEALGCRPVLFRAFPDHFDYQRADVEELTRLAAASKIDLILTTQKDLVKLRIMNLGRIPLRALRIGLDVTDGLDSLESALGRVLP